MAFVTASSGQVLVPQTQYVNPGTYVTHPVNYYPPEYRIAQNKPPPAPGKYAPTFSYTSSIWLGVMLLFCGATAIAGGAIGLRYYAALSEIGAGIWCGAMFVSVGAVAIAAGVHRTDCLICGTTATSAFGIIFGIALVTMSAVGLSQDLSYYSCYYWCDYYNNYYYSCPCYYENWYSFAIVANGMMIGAGSMAIIFTFWLFIVCCVSLCRTPSAQVVPVQYIPVAPQSMANTAAPNQQVLSVPVQYVQLSSAQNHQPAAAVSQAPDHRHSKPSDDRHGDDRGLD